jgi:hypothetical protein
MKLPQTIYDVIYPGAEPLSFNGGVDSWEEKWGVSSSSTPGELLQRVSEKWTTDNKWTKAVAVKVSDAASTTSQWRFIDEKGQAWDGTASVQPAEGNRLVLTLKIARGGSNARAQLK